MKKIVATILFLTITLKTAFGINFLNLKFRQIDIKSGLSNNDINAIVKDTTGYLWIGTENGLNRWDGNEIITFLSQNGDSTALPNNTIRDLHVDKKGRLWIATFGGGLSRYNPHQATFTNYQMTDSSHQSLRSNHLTTIEEDTEGYLWLGTDGEGFAKFTPDKKTFQHFTTNPDNYNNSLSYNDIETISILNDSLLIIGSVIGFDTYNLNTKKFTHYFPHQDVYVRAIEITPDNQVWIATDQGLYFYDSQFKQLNHFTTKNSALEDNTILSLYLDKNNLLWVGTESAGAYLYSKSKGFIRNYAENLSDRHSITHNSIDCIYDDNAGIIWFGTYNGGVNYAQKKYIKFPHYYAKNSLYGLNNSTVTTFEEVTDSTIWVGTDGGGINVFHSKNETFKKYTTHKNSKYRLSSNYVLDIFKDSKNRVWIATYDAGLTRINLTTDKVSYFRHDQENKHSLPINHVRDIYEDSSGKIWVGLSREGFALFNEKKNNFISYNYNNSPDAYSFVLKIVESFSGNLWIGTFADGLIKYNPRTNNYTQYYHDQDDSTSISNNYINDIVEDESGNLWIATRNGLNRFDRKSNQFHIYTKDDGLSSNAVNSLQFDNMGNLWLGTNNGITKIPENKTSVQTFYHNDGLQSNQFSVKAAIEDDKGCLYFGGINGFNRFDPTNIRINKKESKPLITELKIFNKPITFRDHSTIISRPINFAKQINLDYKDYMFSFTFSSTNFIKPEKNKYIYRLFNFDDRWNILKDSRTAVYTNVPPGNYTLKVKSSSNDNQWSNFEKSINIYIKPPFYDTIWFKILFIAALVLSIYGFVVLKVSQVNKRNIVLKNINKKMSGEIKRRKKAENASKEAMEKANEANQLKSEFLANISHEIRTPLNSVIGFSELLHQTETDSIQSQYITAIESSGKTLLRLINDILDLSKIEAGKMQIHNEPINIKSIMQELKQMFQPQIERKGLALNVNIDKQMPKVIEMDETRIRQILINLIGNAVKFTNKGSISITIKVCNKKENMFDARISIQDTGRGIEKDQLDNIFKSFQQNKNQTPNKYGGTGLGLAITKRLINMLNGEIKVKSKLGKGSTFSIYLRKIKIFEDQQVQSDEKFYNTKKVLFPGKQILVVEDLETNILLITNLLKKLDINVLNATNGEEALILLENKHPDLVLMDIRMPVMDGITATEKIRQNPNMAKIPVIALTASVEKARKSKEKNIFDDVIHKPINNSVLINILTKHLDYKVLNINEPEIKISPDILLQEIEDKDLVFILNNRFNNQIQALLDNMFIDNIQNFANDLQVIGKQRNNKNLVKFSDILSDHIQTFNIIEIEKTLKIFKQFIQ